MGQRRGVGQLFVADEAGHFFDQVGFNSQVKAPCGRGDAERAFVFDKGQAQAAHDLGALRLRDGQADDLGRARHAQADGRGGGHVGLLVGDGADAGVGRAADVQNELRDALNGAHGLGGIDAALEAVAGVGGEVEAARATGNGVGPPEGGFHIHIARGVGNSGGVAAHDAGQRLDRALVGDHAHVFIQRDGVAVQQLERLARTAPAHVQAAFDLVQIEDV